MLSGSTIPGFYEAAIPGYEYATFESKIVPAPQWMQLHTVLTPTDVWKRSCPIPASEELSPKEAKHHLEEFVSDQACWGSGPAKNMTVKGIRSAFAYHYELESFVQTREVRWVCRAGNSYHQPQGKAGERIPPSPWEIPAESCWPLFQEKIQVIEVPYTSSIKNCHKCLSCGAKVCHKCHGQKWTECTSCYGTGKRKRFEEEEECWVCRHSKYGKGRVACKKCGARGKINCSLCDGSGLILCYIELTISWKRERSEEILLERMGRDGIGFPKELILTVSRDEVFLEQQPFVQFLHGFANAPLIGASNVLVKKHHDRYGNQIICQKQSVSVVPVSWVIYNYQGKDCEFFVYGRGERKVHAPDYPADCCCGCIIL